MKSTILKLTLLLMVVVMSGFTLTETFKVNKKILGEWEYSVPQAPYEYQEGVLVFSKDGKILKGEMIVGGYSMPMEDLVNEKDNVKAHISIEGEYVTFDLNFTKLEFSGTASYSQGTLEISGKKKE